MPKRSLIYPLFLPMQGCKHRCIYCDQNKISGENTMDLAKELANVSRFIANHPDEDKEVAFYGSSFTALPASYRAELLQQFHKVVDAKTSFRISTHPLYINEEILHTCAAMGIACIELGIQDFCDEVLLATKRGYTGEQAMQAAMLVKHQGFTLGVQLMPGLPASTPATIEHNRLALTALKPEYLRLYPLVVIKGTPLADTYAQGLYAPLELEEAVQICADYAELAEQEGITIIKQGLPSNLNPQEVLAGPFHPSFGEFVLAERLVRHIIREICKGKEIKLDKKQRLLLMGYRGKYWAILQNRLKNCSVVPYEMNCIL
ncbi:MAG: radical SAM protein [Candidatus Cloacimonetes bacterium HGW-Cloacimonetes-3]|jgi:histone acetyltransferase (RNA polymerase elongator complex component)|nr:MAG: radical SAM protein [Candidatus Cloacimonetes bacterium HGW-Cloacimonetes-3]